MKASIKKYILLLSCAHLFVPACAVWFNRDSQEAPLAPLEVPRRQESFIFEHISFISMYDDEDYPNNHYIVTLEKAEVLSIDLDHAIFALKKALERKGYKNIIIIRSEEIIVSYKIQNPDNPSKRLKVAYDESISKKVAHELSRDGKRAIASCFYGHVAESTVTDTRPRFFQADANKPYSL